MKNNEIHEHLWDIFVLEKEDGLYYIFQKKKTPQISVLQREMNCLNTESENQVFQENMDFDLQNTGQSHSFDENLK